jgi:anti-sigma regulatory factor (Ser/Thr protein kinase)
MSRAGEWRTEFPATLEAVEEFCEEFKSWRAAACAALDPFVSELLLREALTNSVVHGSSGAADKRVQCVLRVKPGRLLMFVRDEGAGFDWNAALQREAAPSDTHGRGIEIYKRYASSLRFNPKGNSVMLVKRF